MIRSRSGATENLPVDRPWDSRLSRRLSMSAMTTATRRNYTVKVHDEDGGYWAEVEELPGCFASGDTFDELLEALSEAVGLYEADDPAIAEVATVQEL